jgi:hypothetical protein
MNAVLLDLSLIALVAFFSLSSVGVAKNPDQSNAQWKLPQYLESVKKSPEALILEAEKLFSAESIKTARQDPKLAHAWQDRVAMLSALSHMFDPAEEKQTKVFLKRAEKIMENALLSDPSLLVRDGAVESMRRVNRMRPGYAKVWKSSLESAFMSLKNQSNGEGYFIRETILSAMREAALKPNARVMSSARGDTNGRVRARLEDWNTSSF